MGFIAKKVNYITLHCNLLHIKPGLPIILIDYKYMLYNHENIKQSREIFLLESSFSKKMDLLCIIQALTCSLLMPL